MRREFPKSVTTAAYERSGGICECGCGVAFRDGDGPEYDHVLEDFFGGEPTLENCKVLRKSCHAYKTRMRRTEVDKSRRLYEKRIGVRKKGSGFRRPKGMKFNWQTGRYERGE